MNFICTGNKNKKKFYKIFDEIYKTFSSDINSVFLDEFTVSSKYSSDIVDCIEKPRNSIDFVVSLGGDGSILSAVSRMKNKQLPILGVHIGELGFLNQATKKNYLNIIDDILKWKKIKFQKQYLLNASVFNDKKKIENFNALNDFAINQIHYSRLLKIDVKVDGEFLNRYNCDGIILCSPLGSTAYSLSAGGPIVAQDVKSIIITPVSPHSLSARPIVLKSTSEISITFPTINNRIGIYSDGQSYKSLDSDSIVVIKKSKSFCKLIMTDFSDTYYTKLRKKLNWFDKHRS